MGNKQIDEAYKKVNLTIRIPRWLVARLKEEKGYNNIIDSVLTEYFQNLTKDKINKS